MPPPRPPTRLRPDKGFCNGFRNITARSQLRADVRRSRFWADNHRGRVLGQPGRRGVLGGRRLRVGDLRPHQWSVARPGLGVHGGRRRTIRVVDECHCRASRTGRRPSQSGGQCLRSRVHRDGCAAGHRRQPDVVGIAGRHQRPRPEHPGDRDHRSPLRRDVGPRRRGDVRLRRILSGRIDIDAVRRAAGDHHGRSGSWHGDTGDAVAAGDCRSPLHYRGWPPPRRRRRRDPDFRGCWIC